MPMTYLPKASRIKLMGKKRRVAIVREVRNFMLASESHRSRELANFKGAFFNFKIIDEAFASTPYRGENGDCKYDPSAVSGLNPTLQSMAKNSMRNQCVMGGYMICLSLTSDKRLTCSSTQGEFQAKSREACGAGKVACRSPLFMSKEDDSKTLCVSKVGGSVTQSCLGANETAALSASEIANKFADEEFQKKWDEMVSELTDYCTGNQHTFDNKDCDDLKSRIEDIVSKKSEIKKPEVKAAEVAVEDDDSEEAYLKRLQGKVLCEGEFGIPDGKKLNTKISYTAEGKTRIEIVNGKFDAYEGKCEKIEDSSNPTGVTLECDPKSASLKLRSGPQGPFMGFLLDPLSYPENCEKVSHYAVQTSESVREHQGKKFCRVLLSDGTSVSGFVYNGNTGDSTLVRMSGNTKLGEENCEEKIPCLWSGNYRYDLNVADGNCYAKIGGFSALKPGSQMTGIKKRPSTGTR